MAETSSVGTFASGNLTIGSIRVPASLLNVPIVGDTIYKTGRKTGTTKGRLNATCESIIFGAPGTFNVELFCLNTATLCADGGDSGGSVYVAWRVPLAANARTVAGTLVGSYHPVNFVELPLMYYSPWEEIEAPLGLGTLFTHN